MRSLCQRHQLLCSTECMQCIPVYNVIFIQLTTALIIGPMRHDYIGKQTHLIIETENINCV